ncbi:MAG: hypothetical protein HQK62_15165, partial [Desulfamplus sp.]|nr:hypothetical protein [Desulfamplus sp.]
MDKKMWRIMDANVNRASEGLRVLEDLVRFKYDNSKLSEKTKQIRHNLRAILDANLLIRYRDADKDQGCRTSLGYVDLPEDVARPDERSGELSLVNANFKRVQEALRSLEEAGKIEVGYDVGKRFEMLRFKAYELESYYHKRLWQLKFVQGVYGITHDFSLIDSKESICPSSITDPIDQIRRMVRCGIQVVQLRDKSSNDMSETKKR